MTSPKAEQTRENGLERVVSGGYCIGCGTCAAIPGSGISMRLDDWGRYAPVFDGEEHAPLGADLFDAVCPFSGECADEDEVAEDLFMAEGGSRDHEIGQFVATYAGHTADPAARAAGSSGGLATWLLCRALEEGIIDAVVHVAPSVGSALFSYTVSRTPDAVRAGAKSRYYPVEMSAVLDVIRTTPGRYAVVGIPCFIKSVALLRRTKPVFAERIVLTVGIFCGHLKSARFTEYLVACLGEDSRQVATVDFRKKFSERWASDYGFEAQMRDGRDISRPMSEFYGSNWGYGFFKYEACNYCDDVAAETADVAFGDAWLPEHVTDPRGTNVVVVRTRHVDSIIRDGIASGQISAAPIDVAKVVQSQAAGLRDRREGLAYRLTRKQAEGQWVPRKRVSPSADVPALRRRVYDLRLEIAKATHDAFCPEAEDPISAFEARIRPLTGRYDRCYQPTVTQRLRAIPGRLAGKLWRTVMRGIR